MRASRQISPRTCVGRQHQSISAQAAKDKKGSKKGVSALAGLMKKKAEAEEAKILDPSERASPSQYRDPEVRGLLFALATSYFKATKKFLVGWGQRVKGVMRSSKRAWTTCENMMSPMHAAVRDSTPHARGRPCMTDRRYPANIACHRVCESPSFPDSGGWCRLGAAA